MGILVLDSGYVQFVEKWGSDQSVIEAARMSTDKGFLGWEKHVCPIHGDRGAVRPVNPDTGGGSACCEAVRREPLDSKLLGYLWRNKHHTPFEMAGMTIEVKAPLFVFREWHRHRVPFGYNEMSARYVPLPDENYMPALGPLVDRAIVGQRTANRQASGVTAQIDPAKVEWWLNELQLVYDHAQRIYEQGLAIGIPKEVARLPVPVARYSRMRATGNLRGWLAFLTLRMAPQAQWEIRQYANAVAQLIKDNFPRTFELFEEDV